MNKFILIIALLLTSCSVYKHSIKGSQETFQENKHVMQQLSGQEQNNSLSQLRQQWEQDSLSFQATILATGPYRLSPDSGLSGRDALIRIAGRRNRKTIRQDSLKTTQQDKHENKTVVTAHQASKSSQQQQDTRTLNPFAWWLSIPMIALIIGLIWYFWRKKS